MTIAQSVRCLKRHGGGSSAAVKITLTRISRDRDLPPPSRPPLKRSQSGSAWIVTLFTQHMPKARFSRATPVFLFFFCSSPATSPPPPPLFFFNLRQLSSLTNQDALNFVTAEVRLSVGDLDLRKKEQDTDVTTSISK